MKRSVLYCTVVGVVAGALVTGCVKPPESFVPLPQLLAEYNANAAAVPRLWAMAKVQVTLADGKPLPFTWGSTSPLAAPNAVLLMGKGADPLGPKDFLLRGSQSGVELFRLGANAAQGVYYFWYRFGRRGAAWIGSSEFAGAPGVVGVPIDPHQLLAVLCVNELPDDLTQLPAVTMTLNEKPGEYAYVVSYLDHQPITGRIMFRREVLFTWDDKLPPRPFRINFFDGDGRRVMTARLKRYRPIEVPGISDEEQPPVMPTDIEITWPEKKSRIHIVLSGMTVREEGKGIPAAASRFREHMLDGIGPENVVVVDRHLRPGGTRP